jgi:hypothetical protein
MNDWLPARRVAVSGRSSWLRPWHAHGRLEVNLAQARFLSRRRSVEWRPVVAPTAVAILRSRKPGTTVLRIACGEEIAQFVIARPRVDVLLLLATAVPTPMLI